MLEISKNNNKEGIVIEKDYKENDCVNNEKKLHIPDNDSKSDLNHQELIKLTKETINDIIESDSLLSGLPSNVTVEEIKAQIAVAQGQAITLFLNRGQLPTLPIVVPTHNTTVLDLKKAIKRHMNLYFKRENIKKKISWKRIWKKYYLCFDNVRLINDKENLKTYGISNKAELCYVKRYREKNKVSNISTNV